MRYFYITGCQRSGTTLMRLILECHSRIMCFDEKESYRIPNGENFSDDPAIKAASDVDLMGFKKSGVTMVFVSHIMKEVERICDRAIWIENHSIKKIGSPRDVVAGYAENK